MTPRSNYPEGTWRPAPGAAGRRTRILTQAGADLRATLSNGEQVLLTLIIPLVLLVALSLLDLSFGSDVPGVDQAVPGIMALAVLSTAFTSLAIATGFDRRSGALRLLGTTPLTRSDLVIARALAVAAIEAVQLVLIVLVGLLLGWSPQGQWWSVVVLLVLGTAAFAAWGVALAGVLRAEATLAVANGVFLLLMLGGGVVVPSSELPGVWGAIAAGLPSGALADGLRAVLIDGAAMPWFQALLLLGWAVAGVAVVARTFRWE